MNTPLKRIRIGLAILLFSVPVAWFLTMLDPSVTKDEVVSSIPIILLFLMFIGGLWFFAERKAKKQSVKSE